MHTAVLEGKVQTQQSKYFDRPWSIFAEKMNQGVDSDMTNVTVPSISTITLNEMTNYMIMNIAGTSACKAAKCQGILVTEG